MFRHGNEKLILGLNLQREVTKIIKSLKDYHYKGKSEMLPHHTLNGSLVDKFTYLGCIVSSTETDINTRLAKAWTASHKLSVIWKDKMKRRFFPSSGRIDTAVWMYNMDTN